MTFLPLGIRGRINVALGGVICLATVAFGTGYALQEGNAVLEAKREHLHHLAALAQIQISAAAGPEELERVLNEFDRGLFRATKVRHELIVTTEEGEVVAAASRREFKASDVRPPRTDDSSLLALLLPTSIEVVVPLEFERFSSSRVDRQPTLLKLAEPLHELRQHVLTSLLRHFLFAGGLLGLTMLFAGAIVDRLVVRPVRELAAATEGIARDGDWSPIQPTTRRNDEIGVLTDQIAAMSRRLTDAVRSERYGSAHLVAARVRRELDEPMRRVRIELEVLKQIATGQDEVRVCDEIGAGIQEISEIGRRLGEIQSAPPA